MNDTLMLIIGLLCGGILGRGWGKEIERELNKALEKLHQVEEFVTDGECYYGDGCTDEAMRMRRHGKCQHCILMGILKD